MSENIVINHRQKRHSVWLIKSDILREIVEKSSSFNAILKFFGIDNRSASYHALKRRLNQDNISFDHINTGLSSNKGRKFLGRKKIPLKDILIENSLCSRSWLKTRLLKESLLINKCSKCSLGPEWNGEKLSLQIDHINGVSNDNRIENLRILCPNCHSQTDSFAGRRFSSQKNKKPVINPSWRKLDRLHNRKVERPSKEELQKLLWEKPTTLIASEFGVSDKAIEKWSKRFGLTKPPRGYWQKK